MAQEKWLVDGPKVIDIDGINKLKVGLIGGQVNIVGHDEPGVRIEVNSVPVSYTHLDVYKRQANTRAEREPMVPL